MSGSPGVPDPRDWEEAEDSFAAPALAAGDPTGWYERLYAAGAEGVVTMPWSRTDPHALLVDWATSQQLDGRGRSAVVVGCALGADAEYVASLDFETVAFDISSTAITSARERNPRSPVAYRVADVLDLPTEWTHRFDLVVEIITVQALPPDLHPRVLTNIAQLVGTGGTLLVIGAVPGEGEESATGPWPLRRDELDSLDSHGLRPVDVSVRPMPGRADAHRRVAEYHRS